VSSANAAFDHEIQLVSYQLLLESATGEKPPSLDLVFLVKTKTPQVIRVPPPPADTHRKRRVTAFLETAVEGIASNRHHPQPGMHCSWCQYLTECKAWLPGMTVEEVRQAA
jgi:putative RecB family exonuclease